MITYPGNEQETMFQPISLFIGLRYTRAKRKNHFISFIALMSMIGIALSLIVLITVLSVFNGFDEQIRGRIFMMAPHIMVTGPDGRLSNWKAVAAQTTQTPGILGAAPFVTGQGMLDRDGSVQPVMISGIIPAEQNKVSDLGQKMVSGQLSNLKPGEFGIVIGKDLAGNLGLMLGDKVNLFVPEVSVTPVGVLPREKRFTVVGVFDVGNGWGFNSSFALMNLQDAQHLFEMNQSVSGIQLKTPDLFAAPKIAQGLQKTLGADYQVSDWTFQYGAFYHAVQMEKTMMFLILILLVLIAAFNLVSGLVMAVTDKQSDIAILRTFGATPMTIMKIFMVQGSVIGIVGTAIGLIGGLLLAANVTGLVNFLQNTFHVELFTSNVYFVNYLPSKIEFSDVSKVCLIALFMSVLATIYPAWRAARVKPAEALRYE
jgi:lipoprotein-releasing system permease protein